MQSTVAALLASGKGILAADESIPTIEKRFKACDIPSSEENRRAYRELLFKTPGLSECISGVILFDETIRQRTSDSIPMLELLTKQGIILEWIGIHRLIITARAEVFVSYALSSFRACRDPRAYRGIWRKCCPALGALDL